MQDSILRIKAKEYAKEYAKRFKKLTELLTLAGRTDDLLLAVRDEAVCEKLFLEFGL